jgi:hypothetical protein
MNPEYFVLQAWLSALNYVVVSCPLIKITYSQIIEQYLLKGILALAVFCDIF